MDDTTNTHFSCIFGDDRLDVPTSLKEVVITGGTKINDFAFSNCNSITSIKLPESITSIGSKAFYNISQNANITVYKNSKQFTWFADSFGYATNYVNFVG